ncbi:MAG: UDP-N-acetylmuramoyl-tripeptide--D-alanyl-D-alanine ligase [Clostridiales bacterium]|nr:UDP-N-acetylmuramoyl-tripeptide--D-alanyl-D-alanine ligase [Clostridiales bacterium]
MEKLSIKEITEAVGGIAGFDGFVSDVCTDTRALTENCLFVCIPGERFDGHDFAETAVENGAYAVLCERDTGVKNQIKVKSVAKALLDLSGYYRRLFPINVVGVTGSVGKTTTKEMTHAVLSSKYKTLKTEGNLNNEIGLPKTLFRLDKSYQAAVIEMGMNHLGEISRLTAAAAPTMGIIGNIGVSHLENLGTRENILKAKLEMTDGMKKDAPLILNGDDEYLSGAEISDRPVVYFGIDSGKCRFKASDIVSEGFKTSFTVSFDGMKQKIELPAVGKHNIYNALAAFAAGSLVSVSPEDAARALSSYTPSGMRQRMRSIGGISFIEDCYNASPDSVKAALTTLSNLSCKRRIAVLGDMLELGSVSSESHRLSGRLAAENNVDILLTYGERSVETAAEALTAGVKEVESFDDKEKLSERLIPILRDGDAVLFKASRGMKLEDVINNVYKELDKS